MVLDFYGSTKGGETSIVIVDTPWLINLTANLTGWACEATGHRWCNTVAGPAQRWSDRKSKVLQSFPVPRDKYAALWDKVQELSTNG